MANKLYQHVMVFGREGRYVVRFDNDVDTEEVFDIYALALLRIIRFLVAQLDGTLVVGKHPRIDKGDENSLN